MLAALVEVDRQAACRSPAPGRARRAGRAPRVRRVGRGGTAGAGITGEGIVRAPPGVAGTGRSGHRSDDDAEHTVDHHWSDVDRSGAVAHYHADGSAATTGPGVVPAPPGTSVVVRSDLVHDRSLRCSSARRPRWPPRRGSRDAHGLSGSGVAGCGGGLVQAAAISWAVFGLGKWVQGGGVFDKSVMESQASAFPEDLGFAVHGINGQMVIPVLALAAAGRRRSSPSCRAESRWPAASSAWWPCRCCSACSATGPCSGSAARCERPAAVRLAVIGRAWRAGRSAPPASPSRPVTPAPAI